ncbi:hypothetical protein [Paenibacillus ottowii]
MNSSMHEFKMISKHRMYDQYLVKLRACIKLLDEVEDTFSSFCSALDNTGHINLYDVYHVVEHTAYHLGQIIDRVQRLAGHRFQFVQTGLNEKALRAIVQQSLPNTQD